MEVHKRYFVNKFAGNLTKVMPKQSNIIRFFSTQYEGAFTTAENEFNGRPVPAVFFERFMDIGEAEIKDISKRVGCPEAMGYTCLLGDDFSIALSHEIEKGVMLNRCNASQYSTDTATIIANALTGVSNKTAKKLDEVHIYTIKQTAPSIEVTTISADNILETITGLKTLMLQQAAETGNDMEFKVVMPDYYESYLTDAFFKKLTSITYKELENGIKVTRVDGVTIELWNNIDYMFVATPDAWATVTACYDARAVRSFYDEEKRVTKIDQSIKTGGGYKWQWKNNIDDEAVIKHIITVTESTPAKGNAPTLVQPTKVNDGLRVMDKTVIEEHDAAIKAANGAYVEAVNAGYDATAKSTLGEVATPEGYEPPAGE